MPDLHIYPRGTKLEDIPPYFRGIPMDEWREMNIRAQMSAWQDAITPAARARAKEEFERAKPVATFRDGYGWRGQSGTDFSRRKR